ncbi:hypothetical protein ACFSWE_09485 [Leucobacter albus]|uniref:Uncharacterized protein n=1 Tax=Leucobacter albus TaxID=272210 RepID=A0ABW3TQK7_9MICO
MGIHTGNAIATRHRKLDSLNAGSVILDVHGHAWQYDGLYWYRAYGDSSMVATWDLAQTAGAVFVVHSAPKRRGISFEHQG